MVRKPSVQLWLIVLTKAAVTAWLAAQPAPRYAPFVPPEAAEQLKRAYAAFHQGNAEVAYDLATQVFDRYGDVLVAWFPAWLKRQVSKPLPNPYEPNLGTVTLKGVSVPLSQLRLSTSAVRLLFEVSCELERFDEIARWGGLLIQSGEKSPEVLRRVEYARIQLSQGWVYRIRAKPPRERFRPLSLPFRQEDHFVMVPLSEACRALGLQWTTKPNPKGVGGKVWFVSRGDEPLWALLIAHPFAYRLERGGEKQVPQRLAYPPYEEKGKVWVPFYWLAKRAGIIAWETRDKRIFAFLLRR